MVGAECVGTATTATAGAAAIAAANPPASSSRRGGYFKVGIVMLSVVLLLVCRPKLWRQKISASRRDYADYLVNVAPWATKMVRQCQLWELAVKGLWHRFADACCGTVMCIATTVIFSERGGPLWQVQT
jgi:hypothetical protein